jgi:Serine hydrolase (FSH1)
VKDFDVTQCIPEATSAGFFGTFDETTLFLHRYSSPHANKEKARITLPTTHIVGTADDYYTQGLALRDLCTPNNRQFMEHRAGHDIPKDRNITTKMSTCIQNMLFTVLVG